MPVVAGPSRGALQLHHEVPHTPRAGTVTRVTSKALRTPPPQRTARTYPPRTSQTLRTGADVRDGQPGQNVVAGSPAHQLDSVFPDQGRSRMLRLRSPHHVQAYCPGLLSGRPMSGHAVPQALSGTRCPTRPRSTGRAAAEPPEVHRPIRPCSREPPSRTSVSLGRPSHPSPSNRVHPSSPSCAATPVQPSRRHPRSVLSYGTSPAPSWRESRLRTAHVPR